MVIVFDLGGTNVRMALSQDGTLGEIFKFETDPSAAGFAKFLGALQELAAGQIVTAVAGGLPGQLRGEDGEFIVATNLPEWRGLPVRARMQELFDCPVHLANDVEMNGLGEAQFGAGSVKGIMAYYTISTGVNAVRLIDGQIDTTLGRYELGKQIINHEGRELQSLEPLISGAAIERRLKQAPEDIEDESVWDEAEGYLAAALYNTTLYWNPELIVLGGSMMRDISPSWVAAELTALPAVHDAWPRVVRASLGDQAGLRGAVAWLDQLGYR